MHDDKAGKQFWDESWRDVTVQTAISPRDRRLRNYPNHKFHEYFAAVFEGMATRNMSLLEVGCAKSAWLPYFHTEFGFDVHGIDYSQHGCELAEKTLARSNVSGNIVCADFFAPPKGMMGAYDVVISFGVVEHFADTAGCIETLSCFLKPGGLMVTIIPNMVGLIGWLQRKLNPVVYEIHELIDREQLEAVHAECSLVPEKTEYFMSNSFGVLNLQGLPKGVGQFAKRILVGALSRASLVTWWLEGLFSKQLPVSRMVSPYVNCVARKPRDVAQRYVH